MYNNKFLFNSENEEKIKKIQEEEKSRLRRFRDKVGNTFYFHYLILHFQFQMLQIEGKVKVFVENDEQPKLEFEPMNKMERTIM